MFGLLSSGAGYTISWIHRCHPATPRRKVLIMRIKVFGKLTGIGLQYSGTKSHNTIDVGEKHHGLLSRTFRKLRSVHPSMGPETNLRYSLKEFNERMSPDGLIPCSLVFGCLLSILIYNEALSSQKTRMEMILSAGEEIFSTIVEIQVK